MKIIGGSPNISYESLLENSGIEDVSTRRDKLCLTFASKCLKNDKFNTWYTRGMSTRSGMQYFVDINKTFESEYY
jgi:hypothetical protein